MNRNLSRLALITLAAAIVACGDDNSTSPGAATIKTFSQAETFACPDNTNCQDVFDMHFEAGSNVMFMAYKTTGGSIVQLALYAPGTALGSTNLFTNTANEYRCGPVTDCDSQPAGQMVASYIIPKTGTYRFAVTRDWAESCGGDGTYTVEITSDKGFTKPTRSANDKASLAPAAECP
jgi:hypothetical protein